MPHNADTSTRIPFREGIRRGVCIKVIGVGGGGNHAINRMIDLGLEQVEFISVDTDLQSLRSSKAQVRLQIGSRLTHGLGTGANPEIARSAALDESDQIVEVLKGTDMVFITTGLGGGTGTGVAPIVASAASQMGALTVAIVTLPFAFEGKRRMHQAEQGVRDLLDHVDTLIVIPNDRLLASAKDMGFFESFAVADEVLRQAVQAISDIITVPGVINRDFADVWTTMAGMGYGVMGAASRSGPQRASEAALAAIASPLLAPGAIEGARGILINIAGSNSLRLSEVHEASTIIQRAAHEDANIIFGTVLDEELGGEIKVTVIATGFDQESHDRAKRRSFMRSSIERAPANLAKQPQSELDSGIQAKSFAVESSERKRSEPTRLEIPAELDREAHFLPQAPQSPVTESHELRHDGHMTPESPRPQEVSPSGVGRGRKPLDALQPQVAETPYEDDLLTFIEGLPFDLKSVSDGVASFQEPEILLQTEITRVRQAAMAAYAALSTREIATPEPVTHEAASFAEILESRRQMHGGDETERDPQPDEEMPHLELAASNGGQHLMEEERKAESDNESEMPRLHPSSADGSLEPPQHFDFADSPFLDRGDAPSHAPVESASLDSPATQSLRMKIRTPDFNRRLNREPDFSMGVDVI